MRRPTWIIECIGFLGAGFGPMVLFGTGLASHPSFDQIGLLAVTFLFVVWLVTPNFAARLLIRTRCGRVIAALGLGGFGIALSVSIILDLASEGSGLQIVGWFLAPFFGSALVVGVWLLECGLIRVRLLGRDT